MEDADFDDCGVSLVNHLDKLETNVCSKVEEAKKDLTRTLNFNDMQTRIRDKEHHAETSKTLEVVTELLLASAKKQEQILSSIEDRFGESSITNFADRLGDETDKTSSNKDLEAKAAGNDIIAATDQDDDKKPALIDTSDDTTVTSTISSFSSTNNSSSSAPQGTQKNDDSNNCKRKSIQLPPRTPASVRRSARKRARQTPLLLSVKKRQVLAEQKVHEEKEKRRQLDQVEKERRM